MYQRRVQVFSLFGAILVASSMFSLIVFSNNVPKKGTWDGRTSTLMSETPQGSETLDALVLDSSCVLPCWLGLQLGESNIGAIQEWAIANLGHPLGQGHQDGEYIRMGTSLRREENYYTLMSLWVDSENESLVAGSLEIESPPESPIDWSALMPYEILKAYGNPDEVTLEIGASVGDIYLNLRYNSIGFFGIYDINYEYLNEYEPLLICPNSNNIRWMRIWVQSGPITISPSMYEGRWYTVFTKTGYDFDLETVSSLREATFAEDILEGIGCFQVLSLEEWTSRASQVTPIPSPTFVKYN